MTDDTQLIRDSGLDFASENILQCSLAEFTVNANYSLVETLRTGGHTEGAWIPRRLTKQFGP